MNNYAGLFFPDDSSLYAQNYGYIPLLNSTLLVLIYQQLMYTNL